MLKGSTHCLPGRGKTSPDLHQLARCIVAHLPKVIYHSPYNADNLLLIGHTFRKRLKGRVEARMPLEPEENILNGLGQTAYCQKAVACKHRPVHCNKPQLLLQVPRKLSRKVISTPKRQLKLCGLLQRLLNQFHPTHKPHGLYTCTRL